MEAYKRASVRRREFGFDLLMRAGKSGSWLKRFWASEQKDLTTAYHSLPQLTVREERRGEFSIFVEKLDFCSDRFGSARALAERFRGHPMLSALGAWGYPRLSAE